MNVIEAYLSRPLCDGSRWGGSADKGLEQFTPDAIRLIRECYGGPSEKDEQSQKWKRWLVRELATDGEFRIAVKSALRDQGHP